MINRPSMAKRPTLSGLCLDRDRRAKPNVSTGSKEGMFNICRKIVGENALQNKPIGKHNAHHALVVITLRNTATATTPYTVAAVIASTSLGRYPEDSSVTRPHWEGRYQYTVDTLGDRQFLSR